MNPTKMLLNAAINGALQEQYPKPEPVPVHDGTTEGYLRMVATQRTEERDSLVARVVEIEDLLRALCSECRHTENIVARRNILGLSSDFEGLRVLADRSMTVLARAPVIKVTT